MRMDAGFLLLANVVLLVHTALALFLVLGLVAIFLGGWRGWGFARNRAFRLAHLLGMAVVAGESVAGVACPLTDIESALRAAAGSAGYRGGFIAHWLGKFLYYDCDERVFLALYLAWLALTLWAWMRWPARGRAA